MVSGNTGCQSRYSPSKRILELAQHKVSKTVWATTPCEKINWGNQEPIWPLSASALGTVPTERIQYLARPKRDFSAWDDPWRKDFSRKSSLRPSSKTSCSEHIVRLSTPRGRQRSSRGRDPHHIAPPHTPECEHNCPVWHVDPRVKSSKVVITNRLLQLSNPKPTHPDWSSGREVNVETCTDGASRDVRTSPRLKRLSLPRLKESNVCHKLGRPEESILTVSRAAKRATASPRIERLAAPKELSKDYMYPQDPEWNRRYCFSAPGPRRSSPRKRPLTK